MTNKKEGKKSPAESPHGARLSPRALLGIAIALLVGLAWLQYGVKPKPGDPRNAASAKPLSSERTERSRQKAQRGQEGRMLAVMEKQRRDRETLVRALEKVAAGDARGDVLIEFHRKHGYYSMLVGGGVTKALFNTREEAERVEGRYTFEVTIASKAERFANGLSISSSFEWSSERNELFLPDPESITELWAGVLFAHELSHAHDIVTGGEPRGLPRHDKRFLLGELIAYELEFRLLDRATKGAFLGATKAVADELKHRGGPDEWWFQPFITDADFARVDRIFPERSKSEAEESARGGATLIALNLHRADKEKRGEEGKLRFIARTFGVTFTP